MISTSLRICLSIALVSYFVLIFIFLKRRSLSLKYTLLWILSGIGMALLIAFPSILDFMILIVDIKTPVNGLFAFGLFVILIILMSVTAIVSRQSMRITTLVQELALLEKKVRELENIKQ